MQIMGLRPEECGTVAPPLDRLRGRPEYAMSLDEYSLIGAGGIRKHSQKIRRSETTTSLQHDGNVSRRIDIIYRTR